MMQAGKLDRIGLADAFDVTVFAGDDTAPKPDVEPFERVLATLDVAAERTVWTPADHDLPEDVDDPGSVEGGTPAVDPVPDHVLAGVDELATLLDAA